MESVEQVLELIDDARHEQALSVLDRAIEEDPDHPGLLSLKALVLLQLDRRDEAARQAAAARALAPEVSVVHYAAGEVALAQGEVHAAIAAAREAQALEPEFADYVLLEARARAQAGQWPTVQALAQRALSLEPENEGAAVLAGLARELKDAGPMRAGEWDGLARLYPTNPVARAGRAWSLIEAGRMRDARAEFEQALALDPSLEWAKAGMVVALKGRYPGYGLLLQFFLWMGRLPQRTRWILVIGGVVLYRALRTLGRQEPALQPFVIPLLFLYVAFVLSTWLANPLLDLLLLARPESRRVLSDDDRRGALQVGACLGGALVLALAAAATPWRDASLGAFGVGLVSLTVAGAYQYESEVARRRQLRVAAVLVACALVATVAPGGLGGLLFGIAILGAVASTWVTFAVTGRERGPRR